MNEEGEELLAVGQTIPANGAIAISRNDKLPIARDIDAPNGVWSLLRPTFLTGTVEGVRGPRLCYFTGVRGTCYAR
jgi:hypothetical protein